MIGLYKCVLIIATVILLSVGQVLFKIASLDLQFSLKGMFSLKLILALFVYFIATISWLFVLKTTPLRLAYPFVALAFIIVPVLSKFFLKEDIGFNTLLGSLFIGLGVYFSVYR